MLSTALIKSVRRVTLLPLLLMVAGCSSLTSHSPTWPTGLTVIELSDGGVCMDAESARRLAEFRAELEAL